VYKHFFKRIFDFFLALFGVIMLLLPMLFISLAIKFTSKGPVFFKQKRVGRKKRLFMCLKFRTMRIDTPKDVPTHLLENPEQWITRVGKFLRKTSLDELPQIFNILSGKMSVVGPRPALYNQDDLVAERDKYGANAVRPGLTGLAQISGRDELPIPIKAKYDGEYVKKLSFFFDIAIFFRTIKKVIKREGVKEGRTETAAETKALPETKSAAEAYSDEAPNE